MVTLFIANAWATERLSLRFVGWVDLSLKITEVPIVKATAGNTNSSSLWCSELVK